MIRIGRERFEAGEALFRPKVAGVEDFGFHEKIYNVIEECDIDVRLSLMQSLHLVCQLLMRRLHVIRQLLMIRLHLIRQELMCFLLLVKVLLMCRFFLPHLLLISPWRAFPPALCTMLHLRFPSRFPPIRVFSAHFFISKIRASINAPKIELVNCPKVTD